VNGREQDSRQYREIPEEQLVRHEVYGMLLDVIEEEALYSALVQHDLLESRKPRGHIRHPV
jgi:hypothetical protein